MNYSEIVLGSSNQIVKFSRNLLFFFGGAGMVPPVVFLLIDIYYAKEINWGRFSLSMLSSVITTLTISWAVVSTINWLQQRYPWKSGIGKRLFLELGLTTIIACVLLVILTILFLPIFPVSDLRSALFNWLIVAVIMNLVLVTIIEGVFFFKQWKYSTIEAERYEKESIIAKFENLKNQVSPHFLFNSLNILSSLIDEDKEMSKEFLDNLSQVYRYILQHKDEELVELATELDFVHSYGQLLSKRHVDGISFHINIDDDSLKRAIPPMAVQLLIENAVKHNIVSKRRPLTITIFSQDDRLIVRNNMQPKISQSSSGIGLKNIEKRYRYLSEQNLRIKKDDHHFEVQLPLLRYHQTSFQ